MKSLDLMNEKDIEKIKLIVFDVDGVLVPRGTKIKQDGDKMSFTMKRVPLSEIELMRKLHEKGYLLNVNSGRGLYFLQEMFREILPFVSLTYENGSATWLNGKIYQHVNSFLQLKDLFFELKKIKSDKIKGFEMKEFIITIHTKARVLAIEKVLERYKGVYGVWNSEAYDIGVKDVQTKAVGLRGLMRVLGLKKENVMAIGDNYNDVELLNSCGLAISADAKRAIGHFYTELEGKFLPAESLMIRVLELVE